MVMDIHNMMYRTRKAENHYLRPHFLKKLPPYHQTETWLESRNYRVKPMCSYLRLGSKMQCSGCIISEITLLCVLNAFPGFQATLLPAIRGLHSNSQVCLKGDQLHCGTSRQEPIITALWEASPTSWLKQIKKPTAKLIWSSELWWKSWGKDSGHWRK